jgi:hypothetical protein
VLTQLLDGLKAFERATRGAEPLARAGAIAFAFVQTVSRSFLASVGAWLARDGRASVSSLSFAFPATLNCHQAN